MKDLAAERKFERQNRRVKRVTDSFNYEGSKDSVESRKKAKKLAKQLRRDQKREAA